MNYLVGTSAYSWAARGHRDVVECMRSAERLYLTPVVRAELLNGFSLGSKKSKNLEQFANHIWIAASAMQHGLMVLTADAHFSLITEIRVCWIAAGAQAPA